MNTPTLPPRPFSATEYDHANDWLANQYRNGRRFDITLAPDKYSVIAVNDPPRQAVQ